MAKVRRVRASPPAGHLDQRAPPVDPLHPAVAHLPQGALAGRAHLAPVHPEHGVRPPAAAGQRDPQLREAEGSLEAFGRLMATRSSSGRRPRRRRRDREPALSGRGLPVPRAAENAIDRVSFETRLGDTIAFVGRRAPASPRSSSSWSGSTPRRRASSRSTGVPISELRYNRIRRQIGFVTQDPQLFSGTIRENLLFVRPDATDAEMTAAVHQASAGELLERSGQGLDTRVGEGGVRVSAASGSGSRSPGPSCAARGSSSSTRRRPLSTRSRSRRSRPRCGRSRAAAGTW